MTDRSVLERLARSAGVQTEYYDFRGEHRSVADESCRRILAALDVAAPGDDGAAPAGAEPARQSWQRLLPPVCIVPEAGARSVTLTLPERQLDVRLDWRLWNEDGRLLTGHVRPSELARVAAEEIDGTVWVRCKAGLPAGLGPGYHELVILAPGRSEGAVCRIVVVPEACHEPPGLESGPRIWGVAVQLYTLRSARNWGIGDFGDLKRLAWKAGRAGADLIGLNPLHAAFPADPQSWSPYRPSSRAFLNVLYIDVPGVPEAAGCTALQELVREPAFAARLDALRAADQIDYPAVTEIKLHALRLLYEDFRDHHLRRASARAREFRSFVTEAGPPLETHALFEALHAHFASRNGRSAGWQDWPAEYRDPCSDAVMRFALRNRDKIDFYQYLQWLADSQLGEAQAAARDAGMTVGLYRDLAVGVSPDGSESWANQRLYVGAATVGAPPDELALRGQDWGLPPLHPRRLENQAYTEFTHLMRNNMRDCGALRIDHVMGLLRLWWVPGGAPASAGAYVYYPFADLLGLVALESRRAGCLVIGEDLGTVPDEVREALPPAAVYSYRVLMFEKDPQGRFLPPDAYPRRAVATVSTHDLPPLYSFWEGSDIRLRDQLGLYPDEQTRHRVSAGRARDRDALLEALRAHGIAVPEATAEMTPELMVAVHRYLARSDAAIVMVQPEDWLGMTAAVNVPGTSTATYPNWCRKLTVGLDAMLDDDAARALFEMLNAERGRDA